MEADIRLFVACPKSGFNTPINECKACNYHKSRELGHVTCDYDYIVDLANSYIKEMQFGPCSSVEDVKHVLRLLDTWTGTFRNLTGYTDNAAAAIADHLMKVANLKDGYNRECLEQIIRMYL